MFIDSSKESLEVVLLHIGNEKPSVPIAFSTDKEENYSKMKRILELVKYDQHKWKICCDLKVVQIIMGLRGGFSANQCFLCEWEGHAYKLHYSGKNWKRRTSFKVSDSCIDLEPLVSASEILLPPLHIKLGLVKNFIKALVKQNKKDQQKSGTFNETIDFLSMVFPKLSNGKLEQGLYIEIVLNMNNKIISNTQIYFTCILQVF